MSGPIKAFTLLELVVVIIIAGVLTGLALPRFFKIIEYSRATEALINMSAIRQAIERCYALSGEQGSYKTCALKSFAELGIDDPAKSPGHHFDYVMSSYFAGIDFSIEAHRNTLDGGDPMDAIYLTQVYDEQVIRSGVGTFPGIQ